MMLLYLFYHGNASKEVTLIMHAYVSKHEILTCHTVVFMMIILNVIKIKLSWLFYNKQNKKRCPAF